MIAHRRLCEAERRHELTYADGVLAGAREQVQDLHAMPVAERAEQPLELGCVRFVQRSLGEAAAALDKGKLVHLEN